MGQKKKREGRNREEKKRNGKKNIEGEGKNRKGFYPTWKINDSKTGRFGCSIKFQGLYLMMIVEMQEKDKIKEVIKKMKDHANFVIEQYKNGGIYIERVCIVDSDEVMRQINNLAIDDSKFDENGKQDVALEITDLITGEFVPFDITVNK